jgi:hypothetical protein
VQSPDDLKKSHTAKKVRREARKLFYQLKADPSSSSLLSREKALKIGGIPEHSLIRAWEEDEEYRAFFSALGVQSPDDLKKSHTAKKVRREARKLFHQLKAD